MEDILDNELLKDFDNPVVYGGFWPRMAAFIIDMVIGSIVILPLSYYNVTTWKNLPLLLFLSSVGFIYKPAMEYKYGATLGKMVLNLTVVNHQFGKANLKEILLRNIFHILGGIITLTQAISIFMDPAFEQVHSFIDYSTMLSQGSQSGSMNIQQNISMIIYFADIITLLSDKQKRSLHDRIGKTYVVIKYWHV